MSKFCPFCGEELVNEAKFCKNCGKDVSKYADVSENSNINAGYDLPVAENNHTAARVLGFIFAFLIPLIGFIIGIYLVTRKDSEKAKNHGMIIIAISVVIWIISFITALFMY